MTPPHAASIWIEGGKLHLSIPSTVPSGQPHSINLPATPDGLSIALSILHARSSQSKPATIGTKAAPSQWQTEQQLVKNFLETHSPKRKDKFFTEQLDRVKSVCRELGII